MLSIGNYHGHELTLFLWLNSLPVKDRRQESPGLMNRSAAEIDEVKQMKPT